MKFYAFALAATVLLAVPAVAQTPDAAPPAAGADQGAPPAAAPEAGGKGGKMKEYIARCRSEAQAQGVKKGPDMKKAITDCVVKEHPEMAGRLQCRQEAKDKGIAKDGMRAFMKDCIKSSKG